MEAGESKMSLGYQRGHTWVVDDRYQAWTDHQTYKALLPACRHAGFAFDCRYSYTGKRYTAEIETHEKIGERWYRTLHNNAYDEHPMIAIVNAIRAHGAMTPMLTVLCVELECFVLREKLLPLARLGDAMQNLADTIIVGLLKK